MAKPKQSLMPMRRARAKAPSDASVLLHAIVAAIRDGRPHAELRKLCEPYPRILNRANPFTTLLIENVQLQDQVDHLKSLQPPPVAQPELVAS